MVSKLHIKRERVELFCRKWRVAELALFGSVLREDFGPGSDVDVLIAFEEDVPWTLFDWVDMADELKEIFGRKVDLVSKQALRNPYRRGEILGNREVIYAA